MKLLILHSSLHQYEVNKFPGYLKRQIRSFFIDNVLGQNPTLNFTYYNFL